jgi:hypothetical protein
MPRLERPSHRLLAAFLLLSALSAPLAAQGAPHAAALAGWLQSVWTRATAPLMALWNDGRGGCDPNGGPCGEGQSSEPLPEGRGGCDPDGGPCDPTS